MKRIKKSCLWYVLPLVFVMASCQSKETTVPVRKTIVEAVFASGYVEQEHNYTVSAKVEGVLVSLPVKEGDQVNKEDLIAVIENDVQHDQLQDARVVYQDAIKKASPDSPQLQQLQAQIEQAQDQLAFDKKNYQRYKDLWEKKSISKLEFERTELQYKSAQKNLQAVQETYRDLENSLKVSVERSQVQVNTQASLLKDYQLATKAAGQVINVYKKQGELVRRGEAIAKIGSGTYLIKLYIAEEDITKVQVRQPVAVSINTYPDQLFSAIVTKIYPGFHEAEQSYIVEAQFETMPKRMFSGTQLQANIETGSRENVLVIPTAFLSKGNVVMLANGEKKQIVTGSQNDAWTEVVSGISEGEVVVKSIN